MRASLSSDKVNPSRAPTDGGSECKNDAIGWNLVCPFILCQSCHRHESPFLWVKKAQWQSASAFLSLCLFQLFPNSTGINLAHRAVQSIKNAQCYINPVSSECDESLERTKNKFAKNRGRAVKLEPRRQNKVLCLHLFFLHICWLESSLRGNVVCSSSSWWDTFFFCMERDWEGWERWHRSALHPARPLGAAATLIPQILFLSLLSSAMSSKISSLRRVKVTKLPSEKRQRYFHYAEGLN